MRTPQDRSGAFQRERAAPAERRGLRLGVALGAAAAALVSAGLVYWIGAGEDRGMSSPQRLAAPPARTAYASAKADAGQVLRAYDQVQDIYAEQGTNGVVGFSRSCAASLRSDPGVLDFCLAFDSFAAALGGEDAAARDWWAQAEARDLAMARSVLPPGQDPAARLAQVRALTRQASLEAPGAEAPAAGAPAAAAPPPETARPHSSPAAPAAASPRPRPANAAAPCRQRATPGQRAVCASPALREADPRMRLAYRRALAAGASPRRLARDQARFHAAVNAAAPDRAAIARLYHRRTRALEKVVHSHRRPAD